MEAQHRLCAAHIFGNILYSCIFLGCLRVCIIASRWVDEIRERERETENTPRQNRQEKQQKNKQNTNRKECVWEEISTGCRGDESFLEVRQHAIKGKQRFLLDRGRIKAKKVHQDVQAEADSPENCCCVGPSFRRQRRCWRRKQSHDLSATHFFFPTRECVRALINRKDTRKQARRPHENKTLSFLPTFSVVRLLTLHESRK